MPRADRGDRMRRLAGAAPPILGLALRLRGLRARGVRRRASPSRRQSGAVHDQRARGRATPPRHHRWRDARIRFAARPRTNERDGRASRRGGHRRRERGLLRSQDGRKREQPGHRRRRAQRSSAHRLAVRFSAHHSLAVRSHVRRSAGDRPVRIRRRGAHAAARPRRAAPGCPELSPAWRRDGAVHLGLWHYARRLRRAPNG